MPFLTRRRWHKWPEDANRLATDDIIRLYEAGFAGAESNPEAWAEQLASQRWNGEQAAHEFGLADTGAGKLVIPFVFTMELYGPDCYPGSAQQRGDCVSHGSKNATLTTMCCDVASGKPDEKTGKPEQAPEVLEAGIKSGVLSTETFYWYRGYNGDGWHCPAAAKVAIGKAGAVPRRNYTETGVDLTTYSGRNAGLYGSRAPTGEAAKLGAANLVHATTTLDSMEQVRDFLFNGYGVIDCGGEGYQSTRDANGVSKRSGSWAHSMSKIGFDDRDVIKAKYNEPLVCILNSWGNWNSGPRDILDSAALVPASKKELWVAKGIVNATTGNIMIPPGSYWTPWSHAKNREDIAYSGVNGWPRKVLPLEWDLSK